MRMYMIAGIYSGDNRIGFRILDSDTSKTMDVLDNSVISAIRAGNKIINIELDSHGKLKGSNGDVSRYAKIINNKLVGAVRGPLVILNQIEDTGYTVCDHVGQIKKVSKQDVIAYANKFGIANGKVSSKNGEQFISAISGTYDIIVDIDRIKRNKVAQEVTNETKVQSAKTEAPIEKPVENRDNADKKSGVNFNDKQLSVLKDYYTWARLDNDEANLELEHLNKLLGIPGEERYSDTKLLYEIIAKLGTNSRIMQVFGEELGNHIIKFMQVELPMPESLVITAIGGMCLDIKNTYKTIFADIADGVEVIFSDDGGTFNYGAREYLKYMIQGKCLGTYNKYDSHSIRNTIAEVKQFCLCSEFSFNELRALIGAAHLMSELNYEVLDIMGSRMQMVEKGVQVYYAYLYREIEGKQNKYEQTALIDALIANKNNHNAEVIKNRRLKDIVTHKLNEKYTNQYGVELVWTTPTMHDNIKDVYREQIEALELKTSLIAGQFVNFCIAEDRKYIEDRRKNDAEELAKIQAESLERQKRFKEAKNEQQVDGDTPQLPLRQTSNAVGKNKIQIDIDNGADLSKYDKVELYNELKKRATCDTTGICFKIADDMIGRKLKYSDMSRKQRYRMDEAIDILLKNVVGEKHDVEKEKEAIKNNSDDTETNNTYQLDEHPDIKSNIDRLLDKADTVEMQAVLSEVPNALKIAYSILRYKKASDRQLKHINRAIEILNNQ